MEYDIQEITKKIVDTIQEEYRQLKTLNIMVLGKTGVGKSTLINNVFSEKMAEIGIGKPITNAIRKIEKAEFPLAIYDTPGLELGGDNSTENLLKEIEQVINEGIQSGDINKAIHCIWYCISTPSSRIEQTEIDFIKKFLEKNKTTNIPVIVILTQSFSKEKAEAMRREIEKENLDVVRIIPVLAEDYDINEEYTAKAYGLQRLTEVMEVAIPDEVKKTLVTVQCANLDLKRKRAYAIVTASATTAAGIGVVPIPFSDAFLLVPTQLTMLASISVAFGVSIDQATLMSLVTGLVGTSGATILGKNIVSGLLKMVPVAGSAVGGAISASTAAGLTMALGETYILILTKICKGDMSIADLGTEAGRNIINKLFREQLKMKRKENGQPIE